MTWTKLATWNIDQGLTSITGLSLYRAVLSLSHIIIQKITTSFKVYDKGILRNDQLEATGTVNKEDESPAPSSVAPCY